jgi:DNA-binding transcriptional regulator PaaX
MSSKPEFSKKILKLLAEKPAISLSDLTEQAGANEGSQRSKTAITRSLKGLHEAGLIEHVSSGHSDYARLTKDGKKKAHSIKLDHENTLVNPNWDGKWRIIMLDLPESRKTDRESLRYLLKKAGFVCLKNAVWISPFPFEHLFMNIKKDLGLTTEIMIFVTDTIDPATEEEFLKLAK